MNKKPLSVSGDNRNKQIKTRVCSNITQEKNIFNLFIFHN